MQRAKKSSPTKKDRLVDTAMRLMVRRGYWGTTVDEICLSAHASKGSVFHYFTSKEQLALEALDQFAGMVMRQFQDAHARSPAGTALATVQISCDAMVELARSQDDANGCLLAVLSMETHAQDGPLAERCAQYFGQLCSMLEQQFEAAIRESPLPVTLTGAKLAQLCVAIFEGSLILARVRRDVTVVESALAQFKTYVTGVLQGVSVEQAGAPVRSTECSVAGSRGIHSQTNGKN